MTLLIDEHLVQARGGSVTWRHRATHLVVASDPLAQAPAREMEEANAAPSIREELGRLTEPVIAFRRSFGPRCLTLPQPEVVPTDEPSERCDSLKPELEVQS